MGSRRGVGGGIPTHAIILPSVGPPGWGLATRRRAATTRWASEDGSRGADEDEDADEAILDVSYLSTRSWGVPWEGNLVVTGFLLWLGVFFAVGLFLAPELATLLHLRFTDPDALSDRAYFLLLDQVCETIAGLGLVYVLTRPYEPLPPKLFRISAARPFDARDGWLLWALIGIVASLFSVAIRFCQSVLCFSHS